MLALLCQLRSTTSQTISVSVCPLNKCLVEVLTCSMFNLLLYLMRHFSSSVESERPASVCIPMCFRVWWRDRSAQNIPWCTWEGVQGQAEQCLLKHGSQMAGSTPPDPQSQFWPWSICYGTGLPLLTLCKERQTTGMLISYLECFYLFNYLFGRGNFILGKTESRRKRVGIKPA